MGTLSKSDAVYATLHEMIVSGELVPGAAIDKVALAERLDASRQPVSAAIDRLAFEELVEVIPQRGSFVAALNEAVIADWFMIRTGIEAELAARFAATADAAARRALGVNLHEQVLLFQSGDLLGFHALDMTFHHMIAAASPTPAAHAILARADANLSRVRRMLLPEPGRIMRTLREHREIFAAVEASDPEGANRAMRVHVATGAQLCQDFLARRESVPEAL